MKCSFNNPAKKKKKEQQHYFVGTFPKEKLQAAYLRGHIHSSSIHTRKEREPSNYLQHRNKQDSAQSCSRILPTYKQEWNPDTCFKGVRHKRPHYYDSASVSTYTRKQSTAQPSSTGGGEQEFLFNKQKVSVSKSLEMKPDIVIYSYNQRI